MYLPFVEVPRSTYELLVAFVLLGHRFDFLIRFINRTVFDIRRVLLVVSPHEIGRFTKTLGGYFLLSNTQLTLSSQTLVWDSYPP